MINNVSLTDQIMDIVVSLPYNYMGKISIVLNPGLPP